MKKEIKTMIRNSWDFQEAYYRCIKPLNCKKYNVNKVLFIAAMANIAFSCEMYLKTLYLIENKKKYRSNNKRGHSLIYLFNIISDSLKIKIIEQMNYNIDDFYQNLNENSDNFYKWRYYHEWAPDSHIVSFEFLEEFADCLLKICEKYEGD